MRTTEAEESESTIMEYLRAILEGIRELNLFVVVLILCLPSFLLNRKLLKLKYDPIIDVVTMFLFFACLSSTNYSPYSVIVVLSPVFFNFYMSLRWKMFYKSLSNEARN
jgi:hypothetical protein